MNPSTLTLDNLFFLLDYFKSSRKPGVNNYTARLTFIPEFFQLIELLLKYDINLTETSKIKGSNILLEEVTENDLRLILNEYISQDLFDILVNLIVFTNKTRALILKSVFSFKEKTTGRVLLNARDNVIEEVDPDLEPNTLVNLLDETETIIGIALVNSDLKSYRTIVPIENVKYISFKVENEFQKWVAEDETNFYTYDDNCFLDVRLKDISKSIKVNWILNYKVDILNSWAIVAEGYNKKDNSKIYIEKPNALFKKGLYEISIYLGTSYDKAQTLTHTWKVDFWEKGLVWQTDV